MESLDKNFEASQENSRTVTLTFFYRQSQAVLYPVHTDSPPPPPNTHTHTTVLEARKWDPDK